MQKRHRIFEGEDLESYFFFTFLEALHVKGETSDELLGFCKANVEVKVLSTEQSGETEFIIGRTSLSNSSTLFIIF
jgi:anthranilate phosphoribosyltransferase